MFGVDVESPVKEFTRRGSPIRCKGDKDYFLYVPMCTFMVGLEQATYSLEKIKCYSGQT